MNSTPELEATYYGFVGSTFDALILFEACIAGQIRHVSRRPHDLERERLIRSGSIFIYDENTSGIKRWTDGISWSPSRILGNFLIYRQLMKAFGPGQKKRAIKKPKIDPNGNIKKKPNSNSRIKESIFQAANNIEATYPTYGGGGVGVGAIILEKERALIGSLTDSYDFLEDGLVKKTISVSYGDVTHHLVSYYTVSDALSGTLIVPSRDPRFEGTFPRMSLLSSQNFRSAIEGLDIPDRTYQPHTYEISRQMFLPNQIPATPALSNYSSNYRESAHKLYNSSHHAPTTSNVYDHGLPANDSTTGYTNHHIAAFGVYPASQKSECSQEDFKQHSVAAGSSISEGFHMSMPMTGNLHQGSLAFQERDLEASGVSISMEKPMIGTTFTHNQNISYGFLEDYILKSSSTTFLNVLPNSLQPDHTGLVKYEGSLPSEQRDHTPISLDNTGIWQLGNESAGHGHCQNA